MRTLLIEELEPRQLLNGASLAFQPPPYSAPAAEHSPVADHGGDHAGSTAWAMPQDARAQGEPSGTTARADGTGRGQEAYAAPPPASQGSAATSPPSFTLAGGGQEGLASPAPAAQGFGTASPVAPVSQGTAPPAAVFHVPVVLEIETVTVEVEVVSTFRINTPTAVGAVEPVERGESGRTSPSATTAAPLDAASPGRGTAPPSPETATSLAAVWLNATPSARVDNVAATALPRVEGQGLSGARGTVWAARDGETWIAGLDGVLRGVQTTVPRAAALPAPATPDGEQAEAGPTFGIPRPPVPGVLTFLPAFDLATLERGMEHFLGQLERMSPGLGASAGGTGWQVWMIAGIAAAAACEFARRQLRNPAGVPPGDLRWNTGSPPDASLET